MGNVDEEGRRETRDKRRWIQTEEGGRREKEGEDRKET
jgi:hypothetical protein